MVARALYRYWAPIVFLVVVLQIGLAGYGAFFTASKVVGENDVLTHSQYEDGWGYHGGVGYALVLGALVLVVIALFARVGRHDVWLSVALALLLVGQVVLARVAEGTPGVGMLHAINAVVILALSGLIARSAWRRPAASGA